MIGAGAGWPLPRAAPIQGAAGAPGWTGPGPGDTAHYGTQVAVPVGLPSPLPCRPGPDRRGDDAGPTPAPAPNTPPLQLGELYAVNTRKCACRVADTRTQSTLCWLRCQGAIAWANCLQRSAAGSERVGFRSWCTAHVQYASYLSASAVCRHACVCCLSWLFALE